MATGRTSRRSGAGYGTDTSYQQGARTSNRSGASRTNAYSTYGSSSGYGRGPASSKKSKKQNRRRRPGPLSWLLWLASVAGVVWFLYQLIRINILPGQLLLLLSGILVVLTTLLSMIWLVYTRRRFTKFIMGFLVCAIGAGSFVGGGMLQSTDDMFSQVTNLTDKQVNSVTIYAMKDSQITEPKQLGSTTTLGTASAVDLTGTTGMLNELEKAGASPQIVNYDNVYELVDALYNGEVNAIAFPEIAHDALYEQANDYNKYNALTTFTNVVDNYLYYTDRDPSSINRPDPVANIMTDPFTVLVSANDSYGTIGSNSRSDVNMLVTVNPKTAQVLMVNIPRDSYLPVSCKKNQTACEMVSGMEDKLTHTGLFGIGTTESTVEDAFGITINYYVRVNFSSLINIVDAVGGIDVEVEPGLEVETFYANGTEGVHAGTNHLDGERALAFARERHAYVDGDMQRIRNQSIVLKALLKSLLSPKMVVRYPEVMKALSTAFDTNMSANEIKSLLTLEVSRFPRWNLQSYALVGEPVEAWSPSAGQNLSVTMLNDAEIQKADALIRQVESGQTINLTQADQPVETDEYETNVNHNYIDNEVDHTDLYNQDGTVTQPIQSDPYGGQDNDSVYDPYGGYGGYDDSDSHGTYADPYSPYEQPSTSYEDPYGQLYSAYE